MHAGITPRYRGVHGGYWALVEQHPEWVGTTVHLVDPGIDTGRILAQATFEVTGADSFATYPDLHLVHGLPLLGAQIDGLLAGDELDEGLTSIAPGSGLYYHPTCWGYLWRRWRHGVR
jgi:methionyl-tRNA formyltransferase